MGAALVVGALAVELDSHAARLVLVRMAVSAIDKDLEPRYWGGWEPLARALGRRPNIDGTWPSDAAELAAQRAVDRAVATLTKSGLIKRLNTPRPGRQAEYLLQLDPAEPVDNQASAQR